MNRADNTAGKSLQLHECCAVGSTFQTYLRGLASPPTCAQPRSWWPGLSQCLRRAGNITMWLVLDRHGWQPPLSPTGVQSLKLCLRTPCLLTCIVRPHGLVASDDLPSKRGPKAAALMCAWRADGVQRKPSAPPLKSYL